MYEFFEHTADLGLRVKAESLERLFSDAGLGLFALIVADPASVRALEERRIELEGDELPLLLFDWLNELLYLWESQRFLGGEFVVLFREGGLSATCRGEPFAAERHRLEHEVKAITYHGLQLTATTDGWLGEVIVDI